MMQPFVRIIGSQLVPAKDAVTVQLRNGKVNLTDGPFAVTETKIAGFDLIDCDDKEEAIQIALKHPMARLGTIEIRQLWAG